MCMFSKYYIIYIYIMYTYIYICDSYFCVDMYALLEVYIYIYMCVYICMRRRFIFSHSILLFKGTFFPFPSDGGASESLCLRGAAGRRHSGRFRQGHGRWIFMDFPTSHGADYRRVDVFKEGIDV